MHDLINLAFRMHQSGDLKGAIDLYRSLLKDQNLNPQINFMLGIAYIANGQCEIGIKHLDVVLNFYPDDIDALNNRGIAFRRLGRPQEAIKNFDRIISINSNIASVHVNRGNAFRDCKQIENARLSYLKALDIEPAHLDALINLGELLNQMNSPEEALAILQSALRIEQNDADIQISIGNALLKLHRFDEALTSYNKAIALGASCAGVYSNRGLVLQKLKFFDLSLVDHRKAIEINPAYPDAYYSLGDALYEIGNIDEALASYNKAIELNPDYAEAYNNRGNALQALKKYESALENYNKAIELSPDYAEAYSNRGNALQALKKFDDALASHNKAIELSPDYAEAYGNRGNMWRAQMRIDDALDDYNRATTLKPNYAEAYWNKSLLLILLGQYEEGWKLYEWRFQNPEIKANYYNFQEPKWVKEDGVIVPRLLVCSEQGLGDFIQFCRYLPWVKQFAAELIVEVPSQLVSLVSSLRCETTVITKGDPLPEFDAYCPIMSLPYAFRTTLETIPVGVPYLFANADKVAHWQKKLGQTKNLRVGIAWSGAVGNTKLLNRSISLEKMHSLIGLSVEFHSLQKEYWERDLDLLEHSPSIVQHQDDLNDFSDTAALIECMDLVICIDTSIAHLAGAMGKPLWIMVRYESDYRWMLDREDSPWYPTAKLFRQPRSDDWASVIQSIEQSLLHLMKHRV